MNRDIDQEGVVPLHRRACWNKVMVDTWHNDLYNRDLKAER